MTNQEFKDALIKRAYKYSLDVIFFIDYLDKRDLTVQIISKQLLRSATSISANIIEAQSASSRKDFANFLNHSLKSANETKFWLSLLKDAKKTSVIKVDPLLSETEEFIKLLTSIIIKLRKVRK